MLLPILIDLNIVVQKLLRLTLQTVYGSSIFISPIQIQPGPICNGVGLCVGCNQDFIRQPFHMGIRDFTRSIVGCLSRP